MVFDKQINTAMIYCRRHSALHCRHYTFTHARECSRRKSSIGTGEPARFLQNLSLLVVCFNSISSIISGNYVYNYLGLFARKVERAAVLFI